MKGGDDKGSVFDVDVDLATLTTGLFCLVRLQLEEIFIFIDLLCIDAETSDPDRWTLTAEPFV